jgi:phospholipid transport system substrate-binding protein
MRRRLALALILITLASAPAAARTPTDDLRSAMAEVNRILSDPTTEGRPQDRVSAILDVVDHVFAFREAAEIALGQPWGRLTPAEQSEFVSLFADLVERTFVMAIASKARLDDGLDVRYRSESISGREATVITTVADRGGNDLPISYRMLRRADQWLITDVILDGVSFVNNYRAQFDRVMRTTSFQDLIARMQARRLDAPEWWPEPRPARPRPMVASAGAPSESPTVAVGPEADGPRVVVAPVEPPPSRPEPVRTVEQTSTPAPPNPREPAREPPRSVASAAAAIAPPPAPVGPVAPAPTSAARPGRIAYWVQAGAFRDVQRASQLESALVALKLSVAKRPTELSSAGGRVSLTRVQVGPFSSQAAALAAVGELRKRGYATFVIVDRE